MPFSKKQISALKSAANAVQKGRKRMQGIKRLQSRVRGRQARFNVSKSQYSINKKISNAMSRMSETKLLVCTKINRNAPNGLPSPVISTGTPAVAEVTAWRGVLGSIPSNWDGGLNDLAGIFTTEGTGEHAHIGKYIYLKKTTYSFQLDMTFGDAARPPIQFRLIVAKARQAVTPAGTTEYPQDTLFLDSGGPAVGHATTVPNPAGGTMPSMGPFECMNQPLNKRDWMILRDQRFTLSQPYRQNYTTVSDPKGDYVVPTAVGYSGKYPCRKNFVLNLPHNAKTRLSKDGHPQNYDCRYLIYLYATSVGTAGIEPTGWTVSARGTTSFTDN